MTEAKSILHELYVYSEWKPEPEYLQKNDNVLPENISALWRWVQYFGPKKGLFDSVSAFREKQQKWQIALGDEGKVIAVLTYNILEIRTKRSDYSTIAARTTVNRDAYPQWRKLVWSPDCSFLALAHGNGVVSFFDLTASNLFNIPSDCNRPEGMECTGNGHAVADIIFMPLRVKDTKWSWEVLIATYSGKLRSFLVSTMEPCLVQRGAARPGGLAALAYCARRDLLYVAGQVRGKEPASAAGAGLTALRRLTDAPYFSASLSADECELPAAERLMAYVPFLGTKNMTYVVRMSLSPDGNTLACLHCNGDISTWRTPLLTSLHRWPLAAQAQHGLASPLAPPAPRACLPADVNWWSNEEIILSRFSGAVSICNIEDMVNILGKNPEFFQGVPQVTCAYDGTFLVLECESNILPAKKRSDESMEVVEADADTDDTLLERTKELLKSVLFAITDIETFQPKPRRITVVARIYRLLGVKSTTPQELFSRKIESGNYVSALALAHAHSLDADLVYQQQWRRHPVSTHAIQNYLSKVSKKIWAVHQCVDRLPETLPAAKELLQFGLELTNERILDEINKDLPEGEEKDLDSITLADLNAYTSELLRCRHVMLFYTERLRLYEAILKCEKSTYVKDEYDRLRSNSIVHSAMEIAKEGRIEALTCLWPHIKTVSMQLAVLEKLPETINPLDYQYLLPTNKPMDLFEKKSPIKLQPSEHDNDWCRKEIFRSIWSSNWSVDTTPETEAASELSQPEDYAKWYNKRARQIEELSGLVSHALALITLAKLGGDVQGLDEIMFHLLTLDTLVYDINIEEVTLKEVEKMSILETCTILMKMSTPGSFVADLKQFVIPFLKRYEKLSRRSDACLTGLTDYLESVSVEDLSSILLVLQSPSEFELDVRTHLDLVERCLLAYTGSDQLDMACDLLDTILKESDGSISTSELVRRVQELERLVHASGVAASRGVNAPPRDMQAWAACPRAAAALLARAARTEKPSTQDWDKLLKDLLELQSTLFHCIEKEQCYEIYASALLKSGDTASIKLAADVLTCSEVGVANGERGGANGERGVANGGKRVGYTRSVELVLVAAREYINSSSMFNDPALEMAKTCLLLIKDDNTEIQQELDLIAALHILSAYDLGILPIQVRLCEDRMTLIEDCLKVDPDAFLAGHIFLKLAKLLRIAGDDEQAREGQVLQLVGWHAAREPGGQAAAAAAARRLAELRYARAAPLLAHVATAHAHADRAARRDLLAAAATYCNGHEIEEILQARMALELEDLQQIGSAMKEHHQLTERWPSTEDEFADAVTTPVVETKDLVPTTEKVVPIFNYLLDTFQNKFTGSGTKPQSAAEERSPHCPEFYRGVLSLRAGDAAYDYSRFAARAARGLSATLLHWYYGQNCLRGRVWRTHVETEVVQKCAEELLYKDTPLAVSCLLRSCTDHAQTKKLLDTNNSDTAVCAVLYATLIKCNAPDLRDNVYLTRPVEMAKTTLSESNASQEQLDIIRQCIDKLTSMGEVERLKAMGVSVNGLLFNADADYRREVIYRVASSQDKDQLELALSLSDKYGLDSLDVWLQHALSAVSLTQVAIETAPVDSPEAHSRIQECLWECIPGSDLPGLVTYFSLLRRADERPLVFGRSATEHIKLLKKAKAACSELDYKLLLSQPSVEEFSEHILQIARPENVGMLSKFLRGLPPAFKVPLPANAIYTMWLTKYFFSVSQSTATNKKWMQQYRQCASYFSKLSKDELLQFVDNTCFSRDAVERVPAGTRNLMIMQAVDYCQQAQENDFKYNKNDQTWAQVGQELTRRARFLENYHSSTIQAVVAATPAPDLWSDIEQSHGDTDRVVSALSRLLLTTPTRAGTLTTLTQCLHVDASAATILRRALQLARPDTMPTLITRLTQYHKEGVQIDDDFIEEVMQKATDFGLPPHTQIGLLSLTQRRQMRENDDMDKVAKFSVDLFKMEWPEMEFFKDLTDEQLMSEQGRRTAFHTAREHCDTWQRKKALVDVLVCWPPGRDGEHKSLHCEFLSWLLSSAQQKESLVLIKLLLRRPVLQPEEVSWLTQQAPSEAVVSAIWLALLSKCEQGKEDVVTLVVTHKEYLLKQEIEDELVKELLDNGLFLKLVSTPLYTSIINYIINSEPSSGEPASVYNVKWATAELLSANFLAEAGHLHLMTIGVPSPLRGFSQTVQYCKNMF